MSFNWKGLLGVGGAGGSGNSGSSTNAAAGDPFGGIDALDEKDLQWDVEDVADVPNMLGMRNVSVCWYNHRAYSYHPDTLSWYHTVWQYLVRLHNGGWIWYLPTL
jgi:hypothetical protein